MSFSSRWCRTSVPCHWECAGELRSVRMASITLFAGLSEEALRRRGPANNVEFSVRALAWIIAGHERHHAKIIRERYL